MVAIERILIPIDFSPGTRYALNVAVDLAEKFEAQLYLFHVLENPYNSISPGDDASAIIFGESREEFFHMFKVEAQEAMETLLFPFRYRPVSIEPLFSENGPPCLEIIRTAKELSVNLIIMGNHIRKWPPDVRIGNTAKNVVCNAPCPVMLIKEKKFRFEMS
ncbi:MAG: universal stress protein [Calditrichia bacterium]